VLALDKHTGKVLWKTMRGLSRVGFSSPNIAVVDGRSQVLSAAGDVVQSFDLQTGERLWSVPNFGEGPVPSVVVGEGLPSLTYMVVFADAAARERAWAAFREDPEWLKLRGRPEYADAEIVSGITSTLLRPTEYSQL